MKWLKEHGIFLLIALVVIIISLFFTLSGLFTASKVQYNKIAQAKIDMVDIRENVTHVYLIHPMLVELPDGDIKIVYRIRIYNEYITRTNMIDVRPVFVDVYGKKMTIPLYNIKAIVKGDNKFKEHLLE